MLDLLDTLTVVVECPICMFANNRNLQPVQMCLQKCEHVNINLDADDGHTGVVLIAVLVVLVLQQVLVRPRLRLQI